MKKISKLLASLAVLGLFAACQPEPVAPPDDEPVNTDPGENTDPGQQGEPEDPSDGLTASFSEAAKNFVDPWKVGDEIFGWTSEGTAVTFLVQSVDATTLKATLTQKSMVEIAAGKTFHVVYSPGTTASAFGEKKLEMDLSAQDQNEMPLPLVATATATETGLAFRFACPFAVIGIKDPVFPKASTADNLINITLSGHTVVSSGVLALAEGGFVFTGNAPDRFIVKTVNAAPILSGDSFTIAKPVYIAVPAGRLDNVSAIDTKSNFFVYPFAQDVEAGKYYELEGKTFPAVALPTSSKVVSGGVEWARANLGGNGVTDMGDIFRWSDTGKIYTERASTSSVEFDENHQAGFNSYEGECYLSDGVYTKYIKADGKLVLDPVDDVVQLMYPGSGWRMPTLAEFNALFDAGDVTYTSGTANNVGTTVTMGENTVFFRGTTTVCAPSSKDKKTINKKGRFWTSTISEETMNQETGFYNPDYIQFNTDGTKAAPPVAGTAYRHSGYSIRPVREQQ